ncbi:polymer-forming cytoskeletal protein [Halobacteria archaeon AArc-dxtr1]|nr:polymer-forming cytoskeletal protein [Halobacteria archaeon AArc-dxtr1]
MSALASHTGRIAVLVFVVLLIATLPATVLAQSVDGSDGVGGTVVVEEGETVDSIDAFAGNVYVEGTVTGDVSAVAGNVYVDGEVQGDLSALAGNIEISGTVAGDVEGAAGNVVLGEDGAVGGEFSVGAGTVVVDGTIGGDATIGAETIQLGETAAIEGDLRYDGSLEGDTGVVAGETIQDSTIGTDVAPVLDPLFSVVFAIYALLLNLLLGAALLVLFPRFSTSVADRVAGSPLKSGLVGLGLLVGVPILLALIAITILGIPIALIGALAFALVVWVGIVYGRFAVAAWLLSRLGADNRWLALVVGLVGFALVGLIPIFGGLVNLAVFLLGLGALALALAGRRRSAGTSTVGEPTVD